MEKKTIRTHDLPEKNAFEKALKVFAKTKYGEKITDEEIRNLTTDFQNEVGMDRFRSWIANAVMNRNYRISGK